MPGFFENWQKLYDSKVGKGVRRVVLGKDNELSDEEYINKNGYARPSTSAGILDLMSPTSAAKLVKTGEAIKQTERAARTAQNAKSLKQSQQMKNAIANSSSTRISKTGRVHTTSPQYQKVEVPSMQKTQPIQNVSSGQLDAYKNAVVSANNALEMGNVEMARQFFKDADRFNPYFQNIFRKQGGVISAKSGIHIKKANRGKFTDYCGGKVTSACIAKGKRSPNPAIRKRATFAANARKWKHKYGGKIVANWVYNTLNHEV